MFSRVFGYFGTRALTGSRERTPRVRQVVARCPENNLNPEQPLIIPEEAKGFFVMFSCFFFFFWKPRGFWYVFLIEVVVLVCSLRFWMFLVCVFLIVVK